MDTLRFDDRVAIVTGGARGIGRAHALELARRGATIVVNDLAQSVYGTASDDNPIRDVVAEINDLGGRAIGVDRSIATSEGADEIASRAIDEFGRIDIVVNNAGILESTVFPDVDDAQLAQQLAVHLVGSFNVCRAAWPHLARSSQGRIVMTTSSAALYGMPKQAAYAAAKMGVVGLTRALAAVGQAAGIKVNAIAPGAFTRMTEADLKDADFKEFTQRHRGPGLISPTVAVLAHVECPTTGDVFAVSGGRVARVFIAETVGYTNPDHDADDLLRHWDAVIDERSYLVPTDVGAALQFGLAQLRAVGVDAPSVQLGEFERRT